MKNIISLLALFLTISTYSFSQEFNAGLYMGGVVSQLDGDTFDGFNKLGFITGGYINRHFNKKMAWQMGLRYNQKGSDYKNSKLGIIYKAQLHYMEIPLTIRYYHYKKVDFEAGISMGYLIKALEQKGANDLVEADPPFNKFELATIFGLSYHFSEKLSAGAHFSYSITAARPYSSGYADFMDNGQHNNIIYFTLVYKLSSWH